MRRIFAWLGLVIAAVVGLSQFGPPLLLGERPNLSDHEIAPGFSGIATWLNSSPLSVAGLRGKVVLVQFWTYSCINCLRTLPFMTRWYEKYKDKGFVIIGVHTPEFAFEQQTSNVEAAVNRFGITYPVALDNQYVTWRACRNEYWPAEYLIDQSGKIVATQRRR